jgi:hypothetical protein
MKKIQSSEFIFPGALDGMPIGVTAMSEKMRKLTPTAVLHGFRSSFRDWAGDETCFPREVAEAALAHAVGSKVEQAYRRGDALAKRRELMAAWAAYIERGEPPGDNVAPLRDARA